MPLQITFFKNHYSSFFIPHLSRIARNKLLSNHTAALLSYTPPIPSLCHSIIQLIYYSVIHYSAILLFCCQHLKKFTIPLIHIPAKMHKPLLIRKGGKVADIHGYLSLQHHFALHAGIHGRLNLFIRPA